MGSLEEAIELSKDCCDKKKLLAYNVSHGSSYYNEPDVVDLVCANCRTAYYWSSDKEVARKSGDRKLSDEDLYYLIDLHVWFWRKRKEHSPHYIESFTKNLGLDKSRIEKIIRKSELYSEYGYNIDDEEDVKVEGVTLAYIIDSNYSLVCKSESIEEFESVVNKFIEPYKSVEGICRKSKLQNKIFWRQVSSRGLAINIKGPACEVKDVIKQLIEGYGLPYAIYKPNALFEDADTEKGTEIAKDICIKMGGKVKKRSKLFTKEEKYLVLKKKN